MNSSETQNDKENPRNHFNKVMYTLVRVPKGELDDSPKAGKGKKGQDKQKKSKE
jgi:hypothetical protein